MRVLTFGSTGLTGRYILTELLSREYDVTAFVRNRERINPPETLSSPRLTIFEGDILNKASVEEVVLSKQFDAIVSTIGEGPEIKYQVESKGTKNIIDALKASPTNPYYLLFLSIGMLDVTTKDGKTTWYRCIYKDGSDSEDLDLHYDEHELVYDMVSKERKWLKYTFFCPSDIVDEELHEKYKLTTTRLPPTHKPIFAGTLAEIVVNELTNQAFVGERVAIEAIRNTETYSLV